MKTPLSFSFFCRKNLNVVALQTSRVKVEQDLYVRPYAIDIAKIATADQIK
jgi:hypothetical protein